MKTLLLSLVVCVSMAGAQIYRPGGGGGSVDSANFAKKTDLLYDATSAQELNYVKGDTLKSRPAYSAPCWTLPASILDADTTAFNYVWFSTTFDSLAVDSVVAVLTGVAADTVSLLIRWGSVVGTYAAGDSFAVIKCDSGTKKTVAASTKVIPPNRFVSVSVTEYDGAPHQVFIMLNGRRKWAQ
jgi:hypothetical protein